MHKLSRRQFLYAAAAAGALTAPAVLGARLLKDSQGDPYPNASPFPQAPSVLPDNQAVGAASIIVLANAAHPNFAAALGEILRAEGVLGFVETPLSGFDWQALRREHIVLLGAGPLASADAEALRAHVQRGGGLVAMRPDTALHDVLGVARVAGQTGDGYLCTADHAVADGVDSGPLQFHAPADHYDVNGAEVVAWLCNGLGERTHHPAVTIHTLGQGRAAMWAFDLARSVVFTRQGNPEWVNMQRDGLDGIRASDMFVGWIDLDRIHVPQADEQQRLLSNLLHSLSQGAAPLPRLWYFPHAANSLLVATGDAHLNPPSVIDNALRRVERHGGTMSVCYTPQLTSTVRKAARRMQAWAAEIPMLRHVLSDDATVSFVDAEAWRARGHELALHPYVEAGLEAGWRTYWDAFTGYGLGHFTSARTHRVLWHGWVDTARVQAAYGVRMNLDFYHLGPAFQKPDGQWAYGYLTGSGLPMRFVDEAGRVLNIYQQLTPLVDEQVLNMPCTNIPGQRNLASAIQVSQMMIDRAINGAYAAMAAQFHIQPCGIPGPWEAQGMQWMEATLAHCVAKGVPIWSAERWTQFTEVRHQAAIRNLRWDAERRGLTFDLDLGLATNADFSLMLPLQHGAARLAEVQVDGRIVDAFHVSERQVGGVRYGCVSLPGGTRSLLARYASV